MAPVVLAALLLAGALVCVDGHGYLAVPKSRNLVAQGKGLNYCPHCMNGGTSANVQANDVFFKQNGWSRNYPETAQTTVRHGLCGDPAGNSDHLLGGSIYGSPVGGDIQATYTSGQSIDVNTIITAHHMGWWQVYLCDKADALSQDCLNKHLLLRDPNDPSISPVDPNFPGRYYMIPTCYGAAASMNQTARYKLPAGLTCTNCVLQWYWVTANSCHGGGYTGVNFPPLSGACSGDGGSTGWYPRANSACADPLNAGIYPEEFWNCADVRIVAASGPTTPPTSASAQPTTSAPAPTPLAPTPQPTTGKPTTGKPTAAGGICSALWGQCGGQGWAGATCCAEGAKCVAQNVYYSQCVYDTSASAQPTTSAPAPTPVAPTPQPTTGKPTTGKPTAAGGICSALWGQCGGQGWAGATCCTEGAKCAAQDVYYSQCVYDPTATCLQPYDDCTKAGSRCCAASTCVNVNANYKQCKPS